MTNFDPESNRRVKVLLTADGKDAIGGINVWAQNILAYGLNKTGSISIDAVGAKRRDFTTFTKSKIKRFFEGVVVYFRFCVEIAYKLKKERIDILHIVSSASYGLLRDYLLIFIAHCYGAKAIVHFHFGRIPSLRIKDNWEWRFLLRVVKFSDFTIVLDRHSLDALRGLNIKHVIQIPNPLSPTVCQIVDSSSSKRDNQIVLYVGQCYQEKGIYEFVEVCKTIPNVTGRMIGSISDKTRESLRAVAGYGNPLDIVGKKAYKNVINEMLRCSVFVLPSYSEGFPNVILEAMACGCPIVATSVGAIPEMLAIDTEDNCGICVPPGEKKSLKAAIEKMLIDKTYAERCGRNAQQRVKEQYSIESVWSQMAMIWEKICV